MRVDVLFEGGDLPCFYQPRSQSHSHGQSQFHPSPHILWPNGEYLETNNRAGVIFPEGTRSKDGYPKPFKTKGLEILMKKTPSALIVPITVNNSWKMLRYGKFPMGIGNQIKFTVHKPLEMAIFTDNQALLTTVEKTITDAIRVN